MSWKRYAAIGVDALQRGNRPAGQTKLTVIVILNDRAAGEGRSPGQKLVAAGDRHGDAGRKVVGRTDMDHIGAGGLKPGNGNTQIVHGRPAAAGTVGGIDLGNLPVAWIFKAIDTVLSQKLDQQTVKILGPRADNDLVGVDRHAAKGAQVGGDGLTQRAHAAAGAWMQQSLTMLIDGFTHQMGPDREGKACGGRAISGEVQGSIIHFGQPDGNSRRLGRAAIAAGKLRYIIAAFRLGTHIPLINQAVIGRFHRNAADAEIAGKTALGRQTGPGGQTAGENVTAQKAAELFIQRAAVIGRQGICQHGKLLLGMEKSRETS